VKRLRANDSAATSVKVGYRQAFIPQTPAHLFEWGFCFCKNGNASGRSKQKLRQDLSTQRH
ncbi:hypothetical protein, partial [Undibacterium sp. TC9W]|uniref:hypothetical protein n=1 Tax=Undibacterium sp. TC9W TaxID=3413053 RepID=UPI003BF2C469